MRILFTELKKKIHQIKFCQFTPLQIEYHPESQKGEKGRKKKKEGRGGKKSHQVA